MAVSRRELLKLGLLAAPGASLARLAEAQIIDPGSPPVIPFMRALRIPPVATTVAGPAQDNYDFTMQTGTLQIIPARQATPIWGYSDQNNAAQFPGPTIKARANRTVRVRQHNNLGESMSVHLHGGHTEPQSDGHPTDLIPPGGQKDYNYANSQLPATLWYHDHAVDVTGQHIYMGLAGFYLIGDAFEDALNLPGGVNDPIPNGVHDVPLLITDRNFNRNSSFSYALTDDALVRGVLGDRILVNGVIQPFFRVPRRKVRFRILNASNARIYDFRLSNGQPFIQIGSDGGLLGAPASRTMIRLSPAERADVVIDFGALPLGTQVILRNSNRMIPLTMDRAPRDLLRFEVDRNETDTPAIPGTLRPVTPLGTAARTRVFNLTRGVFNGRTAWFINNNLFDPLRIDANPANGEIETWTFTNQSNIAHPMHIHLVQFQIQGAGPGGGEDGWKDTVLVPAGGTVNVKALFAGQTGTYVFHCHLVEHEDHAMMAQFAVTP